MTETKDTIIAIATGATSSGGLGVIRISGTKAKALLNAIFLPKYVKNDAPFSFQPRYMHYGSFVMKNNTIAETVSKTPPNDALFIDSIDTDTLSSETIANETIVDEVLAVYFPAPNSYTGEDVAEIHAHGGSTLLASMLEYLLSLGNKLNPNYDANIHKLTHENQASNNQAHVLTTVRHAEAGEFTKRAFLNGRIDLSQAEAVAEIIAAPALEGVKLAAAKLNGALGKRIEHLRDQIEYIRRRLCLAIDFPEEEGECLPTYEFHSLLDQLQSDMTQLISAYDRARPWSEGSLVVLAGQVNAGKSSLMNAILGRKRAIVTAEAGTTRDYLEEHTFLDGLSVRLTDTAGLREIAWLVEQSEEFLEKSPEQVMISQDMENDQGFELTTQKNASPKKTQQDNAPQDNAQQNNPQYENTPNNKDQIAQNAHEENEYALSFLNPEVFKRLRNVISHEEYQKRQHLHIQQNAIAPISLIEAEGICRSLELMEGADLILLVFDGVALSSNISTQNTAQENAKLLAEHMQKELMLLPSHIKKICIWNKVDRAPLQQDIFDSLSTLLDLPLLCMSAKGIETIQHSSKSFSQDPSLNVFGGSANQPLLHSVDTLAKISRSMLISQDSTSHEIAPNRRQAQLLQKAYEELSYLKEEIDILPPDLTAIRLESASQYLFSITGLCSIDDTFNAIFEDFCIGK